MKISLNWLKDFVKFETIEKKSLEKVVIGYVKDLKKHPDADNLNVAQVDVGKAMLQIVCGGINLKTQIYVPVALPGAILPGNFKIEKSKIRGQESEGMICAEEELGLGTNPPRSIWILDPKKAWTLGTPILKALNLENALSAEEIGNLITKHTAEVEGLIRQDQYLNHVVAGELIEFEKINDSKKLHKGVFDIGWKKIQIVFGSVYQLNVGDIIPIALPGAILPGLTIKQTEFSGVKSEGMACGDDEIGIQNSKEGITRFPKETVLGKPVADILNMQDIILDIDNKSLTHRPDLWGHYGFAREIAAIFKKPLEPLKKIIKPFKADETSAKLTVKIANSEICPRFSGCIMTGITMEESPEWLKSRLQAVGIKPINNIVDVTNAVMVELGQPMHAYDRKILGSDTLTVRTAKREETLKTIDHKIRKLHENDPVVANDRGVLGVAGIMGGSNSEITENTTEIILEAANWNPVVIRKSSVHHGLRTEASQRFEKSLDPTLTEWAIRRAVDLIRSICPKAKVVSDMTTAGDWKPTPVHISVNPENVKSVIGIDIPEKTMMEILESLEFRITKKGRMLEVAVPSHRATKDISIKEDVIEEIARLYGYDAIPEHLPELPTKLPIENEERFHKHTTRSLLAKNLDFTELSNYSFYSRSVFERCGLEEMHHIKVKNPLSEDQTHMRLSLIPGFLKKIEANQLQKATLRLFEIGRTYREIGEFMPLEEKWLAGTITHKEKKEIFYDIKGALETFLDEFRPTDTWHLKESTTPPPYAHPKKCMDIVVRGETIGNLFTLHPKTAKIFGIEHEAGFFELNFTKLVAHGRALKIFRPLHKFPSIFFDISALINQKTTVAEIEKIIRRADSSGLVIQIKLFDIYEGKNIPEGKKSLAFNIELRSEEGTLTDETFQATQKAIFMALEKMGGQVRGK